MHTLNFCMPERMVYHSTQAFAFLNGWREQQTLQKTAVEQRKTSDFSDVGQRQAPIDEVLKSRGRASAFRMPSSETNEIESLTRIGPSPKRETSEPEWSPKRRVVSQKCDEALVRNPFPPSTPSSDSGSSAWAGSVT